MTFDEVTLRKELRQFIVDSFIVTDDQAAFSDEDSFMRTGLIDSTGVLELTAHLEVKYGVELSDAEMLPSNLDSIDNLVRFLGNKLNR